MSEQTEPTVQTGPATPGARRRRVPVALVATAVGLALLCGAGAWGWSALKRADRSAPTVVWAEPAEHPELDFPSAEPSGLAAQLLPLSVHYVAGPDVDEYGNDSSIGAARAVALLKQGSRGLPSAQRKRHDKAVEKLRIKGLAARSYRDIDGTHVVETRLAQMENTRAVRDMADFQREMTDALGVFRKGPKIKGHPKAACHVLPGNDDLELDAMICTGQVGEVLVTTYAYGAKSLPTRTVAETFREQLDHIASPGESV
ncbi:hypothetical protein [Streptomyces xantholiticus]|uniref:hypothetical protein n=1 Tax=Streptomyces xantholiticus TaxID=68285 RepID=UPI00167A3608|nr:hypothetical protein [Streptomyces xantholiticus]GGW54009.1 hypothetical protein GCM10010381_44380 [Streptomyces xantholiticus]